MVTRDRPLPRMLTVVAVLTVAVSAALAVQAQDPVLADDPVLAAADDTSGADAVDVSRAAVAPVPNTLAADLAAGTRPESDHLAVRRRGA